MYSPKQSKRTSIAPWLHFYPEDDSPYPQSHPKILIRIGICFLLPPKISPSSLALSAILLPVLTHLKHYVYFFNVHLPPQIYHYPLWLSLLEVRRNTTPKKHSIRKNTQLNMQATCAEVQHVSSEPSNMFSFLNSRLATELTLNFISVEREE